MNQYTTSPKGPTKYTNINGINTKVRPILYFTPSLEIQVPKKRFKDIKCNQKTSRKLSDANTV